MTDQENDGLLTDDEMDLVMMLGDVAGLFRKIAGTEVPADLTEIVDKIHQLQHTVLAQSAARRYPTKYRVLGKDFND